MRTCHLLLDAEGVRAYDCAHRTPTLVASFSRTTDDLQRFARFLAGRPRDRFAMLVDLAGEERLVEGIPPLRGGDRQAVIARRLTQRFPAGTLTCVERLGREPAGRRDERLLFSAIPEPPLHPWLQALQSAGSRLDRIQSSGQLAAPLLATISPGPTPALLLTVHMRHLRASLVVDGRTILTRLVPFEAESPAQSCAREATAMQRYVATQNLVPRDVVPLPHIVAPAGLAAAIRASMPSECTLTIAGSENAEALPESAFACDSLHLRILLRRPPGVQFAPRPLLEAARLSTWQQRLVATGIAGMAVGALAGGTAWQLSRQPAEEAWRLRQESAQLEDEARRIAHRFPSGTIAPERLQQIAGLHAGLQRLPQDPLALWQAVSRALDAVPSIRLETIETKFGDFFPSTAAAADGDARTRLRAVLEADADDPRDSPGEFERFVAELRADPSLQLTVVSAPGIPTGRGRRSAAEAASPAPRFTLDIRQQRASP